MAACRAGCGEIADPPNGWRDGLGWVGPTRFHEWTPVRTSCPVSRTGTSHSREKKTSPNHPCGGGVVDDVSRKSPPPARGSVLNAEGARGRSSSKSGAASCFSSSSPDPPSNSRGHTSEPVGNFPFHNDSSSRQPFSPETRAPEVPDSPESVVSSRGASPSSDPGWLPQMALVSDSLPAARGRTAALKRRDRQLKGARAGMRARRKQATQPFPSKLDPTLMINPLTSSSSPRRLSSSPKRRLSSPCEPAQSAFRISPPTWGSGRSPEPNKFLPDTKGDPQSSEKSPGEQMSLCIPTVARAASACRILKAKRPKKNNLPNTPRISIPRIVKAETDERNSLNVPGNSIPRTENLDEDDEDDVEFKVHELETTTTVLYIPGANRRSARERRATCCSQRSKGSGISSQLMAKASTTNPRATSIFVNKASDVDGSFPDEMCGSLRLRQLKEAICDTPDKKEVGARGEVPSRCGVKGSIQRLIDLMGGTCGGIFGSVKRNTRLPKKQVSPQFSSAKTPDHRINYQVIACSSERDSREFAASNLNPNSKGIWESCGPPSQWIVLDFGSEVQVRGLAFGYSGIVAEPKDITLYRSGPMDLPESDDLKPSLSNCLWIIVQRIRVSSGLKPKSGYLSILSAEGLPARSTTTQIELKTPCCARYWKLEVNTCCGFTRKVRMVGPLVFDCDIVEGFCRQDSLTTIFDESVNLDQDQRSLRELTRRHNIPLDVAETVAEEFNRFAPTGSSFLRYEDFVAIVQRSVNKNWPTRAGDMLPDSRMQHLWKSVDSNQSGHVDLEEFLVWFNRVFQDRHTHCGQSMHSDRAADTVTEQFYASLGVNRLSHLSPSPRPSTY